MRGKRRCCFSGELEFNYYLIFEYKIQNMLIFLYWIYPIYKHIDGSQMATAQALYTEAVLERGKEGLKHI